jgi:hypothetical protein
MPVHITLSDYAVSAFLEGFAAFQAESESTAEGSDAMRLAKAVVQVHLGVDKALKEGLSAIDPALVIAGLKPEVLHTLHRLRLETAAPSILSIRTRVPRVESLRIIGLLKLLAQVKPAALDPALVSQAEDHLRDLADLRNQIVHLELYEDRDHILSVLAQVLALVTRLLNAYSPETLNRLLEANDQLFTRLDAIEQEIDAAWAVIVEYLRKHGSLAIKFEAFISHQPGDGPVRLSAGSPDILGRSIALSIVLPRSKVTGFLGRSLAANAARFAVNARKSPMSSRLVGLLGGDTLPSIYDQEPVEGEGFVVSDDGRLSIAGAPAYLALSLPALKRSYLAVNVKVRELEVVFTAGQAEGRLSGTLVTVKGSAPPIPVTGTVWFAAEYHTGDSSDVNPPDTTVRNLVGEMDLHPSV